MTILEERGLFWWHGEPVPDTQFAANASVLGLLTIDDDGLTTLALDGCLPSDHGPMAVLSRDPGELKGKLIEGNLSTSGKHVLLSDLAKHGGHFRTNNLSQEGYRAINCLVSYSKFPAISDGSVFDNLEIDLTGFEDWLRLGSIETVSTDLTISVEHRRKDPVIYDIDEGKLSIEYDITRPYLSRFVDHKITITEKATLIFAPKVPITLQDMRTQLRVFEDLFIILTNSEYNFLWPTITTAIDEKSFRFEWFSYRKRSPEKAPERHECLTNFIQLRDSFGQVVSKWLKKREKFGPGFYLYLAVRRGMKFYPEHRFVNLIWGIEALHRKKYSEATPTQTEMKIKDKVKRIIDQIELTKDKKWLKVQLRNACEPPLEKRIIDVIAEIPINLEEQKIKAFATRCAKLRNDISHFGSQRHGENYQEFVLEVTNKSDALAIIFHMLILHEIGIDEKILNWWIYEGFQSYRVKSVFVAAGLLDESVLKPASPPAGAAPS